jgi:hypothetical protein
MEGETMGLESCKHPDTIVVHDSGRECPLCQALSDLTDAQQQTALAELCGEAIDALLNGPAELGVMRHTGARLSATLDEILHDVEVREQMS